MVRLTIHTINSAGAPQFPLKAHTLRFPVICGMKDSEVEDEIKKFKEAHPDRSVIEWKKDILHYSSEQEAMEMACGKEPEPEYVKFDKFEEPL